MENNAAIPPISPANSKKLKQTRLPFAILSPSTPKSAADTHPSLPPPSPVPCPAAKKQKLDVDHDAADGDVKPLPEGMKESSMEDVPKENKIDGVDDDDDDSIQVVDLTADDDKDAANGEKETIKIKFPFGNKNKLKKTESDGKICEKITKKKKTKKVKCASVEGSQNGDSERSCKRERSPDVEESSKKPRIASDVEIIEDEDTPKASTEVEPSKPEESPEDEKVPETKETEPLNEVVESLPEEASKKEVSKADVIELDCEAAPSLACSENLPSTSNSAVTSPAKTVSSVQSSPGKSSPPPKNDAKPKEEKTPKPSNPNRVKTPKSSHKKLSEEERAQREKLREEQKQEKLRKLEEEKQQKAKEREEKRLKEKAEREAVKQKEREEKEQARQKEKFEREEKLRKEREEKEQQKREKERKRQEEIDAKNEEKRKKEEEKLKKEEEKLKKDKKSVELFQNFFVKKTTMDKKPAEVVDETSKESTEVNVTTKFMPFQLKENMKIAPTTRNTLSDDRKMRLEKLLDAEVSSKNEKIELYLEEMKKDGYKIGTCGPTLPPSMDDADDDIEIIDTHGEVHEVICDDSKKKRRYRTKFLKFGENRRPPYYGTWRKRSKLITARRPFGTDNKFFDYEIDSDLEWEEEEEGESLHGSDDEKERDAEDEEYELDNDFFVPHGHLSDEEMDAEEDENNSPEAQKAKLQLLQLEFAEEMKKKTEKIKPRLIGCIWIDNDELEPESCSPLIWATLQTRAMLHNGNLQINWDDPPEDTFGTGITATPSLRRMKITDDHMPDLIRLVHRNLHSRKFLIEEFNAFQKAKMGEDYVEIVQIGSKIKEIAEHRQFADEGFEKYSAWIVKPEILEKFSLTDLPLENAWTYTLTPKRSKRLISASSPSTKNSDGTNNSNNYTIELDDESAKDLIHLVHGNTHSRKFLVHEFTAFRKAKYGERPEFKEIRYIGSKIKKIAEWKQFSADSPLQGKFAWCVKDEVLEKYDLKDLKPGEFPWKYTIEPSSIKKKSAPEGTEASAAPMPSTSSSQTPQQSQQPGAGSIEKFAKKLTEDDKKNQFKEIPKPKKRVALLMSVPCGETIPEAKKNTLISQFLSKNTKKPEPMDVDNDAAAAEVITID